ncbi:hypothetical protein GCM10028792_09200 [Salinisphaera aquimarina]
MIALLFPLAVLAGPTKSISPFMSSSFDRTIHGDERTLDLSRLGRGLGSAEAFFGVDSLSTEDRQYLTSGLQWRSGQRDASLLRVSALRTEGDGTTLRASQTLVRAENQLDLGGRWYLPDLTTELAQVSNTGADTTALGGRAARIGLSEQLGGANYNLGYFQADPEFSALGSSIAAGDRGVELDSEYGLGTNWQFAHELRFHQATQQRSQAALAQKLVLSRSARLSDVGTPWRLSAQLGAPVANDNGREMPIALELASQTARWRSWRVDSSLGWYDAQQPAPLALPVQGTMWQVSASRGLSIAGLNTLVSPSFSLGGSQYDNVVMGTRTGLSLGFSQLSDNIDLSLDYLSAGWSPSSTTRGDLQMTLNFTQSTAAIMPGLRSMANSLRVPWQRRY